MGEPMWNALKIREDLSAGDLRQLARKEGNRRTAMRMLAIANALEGMSRAEAALKALVLRGPDPEKDGISRYTIADICRLAEDRFGVRYAEPPMGRLLKRLGLSRQKARPVHPKTDRVAQERFKKGV